MPASRRYQLDIVGLWAIALVGDMKLHLSRHQRADEDPFSGQVDVGRSEDWNLEVEFNLRFDIVLDIGAGNSDFIASWLRRRRMNKRETDADRFRRLQIESVQSE